MARHLMSDDEWAFFEGYILAVRAPNGRKGVTHRLVLDGVSWIERTGVPWRDLPEEFGKWSSVYRQFRRWTLARLWGHIMDALNESGAVPDALQMIDSTVMRKSRKMRVGVDHSLYRLRNLVERYFNKPKTHDASQHVTTRRQKASLASSTLLQSASGLRIPE